jgi:sec-independent protein translocase protein TatA
MFEGLFQPMHLLVIGFIAMLVFGPKRLPELGKGLGEGLRQFKSSMNDITAEPKAVVNEITAEPKAIINEVKSAPKSVLNAITGQADEKKA